MKIFSFLKAKSTIILAVVCAVLVVVSTVLFFSNKSLKSDNGRLKNNQANLIQKDSSIIELTLTRNEFKESNLPIKKQIDSTAKKNKIKQNRITEYSSYKSSYLNSDTVKADTGSPEKFDSKGYLGIFGEGTSFYVTDSSERVSFKNYSYQQWQIPVSKDSICWGMEGYILTIDPNSELYITERTASSSVELLILRKRFLGFLWWKRSKEYKTYDNCGEIKIEKIKFVN